MTRSVYSFNLEVRETCECGPDVLVGAGLTVVVVGTDETRKTAYGQPVLQGVVREGVFRRRQEEGAGRRVHRRGEGGVGGEGERAGGLEEEGLGAWGCGGGGRWGGCGEHGRGRGEREREREGKRGEVSVWGGGRRGFGPGRVGFWFGFSFASGTLRRRRGGTW